MSGDFAKMWKMEECMNGIFVHCMLIINGYCAIGRFLIICIYGKKKYFEFRMIMRTNGIKLFACK